MDTQTVIAVCELLLVVIGIVSLTRKDEGYRQESVSGLGV